MCVSEGHLLLNDIHCRVFLMPRPLLWQVICILMGVEGVNIMHKYKVTHKR